MKKIILIVACLFLVVGCGHIKLANGENAVVKFDELDAISSEDLYKKLKEKDGINTIIELIDTKILDSLYPTDNEAKKYVNESVKYIKNMASDANASLETYISYYFGLKTESAYRDYVLLNYKRGLWQVDYAKESVNEKQLNDYYKDVYFGDIEAKHILITVDVDSDATDDEKTEAENKALEKANQIIEELNNNGDFDKLAKEYSDDKTTASNGGSLGKINLGGYSDEVVEALNELEDNSYSKTPVKSSYGYHIVYKVSQEDKKELSEVEDYIRSIIGSELQKESGFSTKALKALREKYNVSFEDKELEDSYKEIYGN